MTDIAYILSSLRARFLGSVLTIMLVAFGVAMALIILLFTQHIQTRMTNDANNIDIVIGAKGSPLQIILSSVYHIDIPTGNFDWDTAQKWMKHPQVKKAVPLALGDNWRGYRIVGTTPDYLKLYQAKLRGGTLWDHTFEAVIGAHIDLAIGDKFSGAHGFSSEGHVHDNENYTVVGQLKETGTVLDRLILTSIDSVLEIHGLETVEQAHASHDDHHLENHDDHTDHHEEHRDHDQHNDDSHDHDADHHDHSNHAAAKRSPEITALLLQTKTPIANMRLPHIINQDGALQAANPALEMARLTSMLGVGTQTLTFISGLLMMIACFSIFAGIAGTLETRKTDLAVLRAIGYSRSRIFTIIAGEGLCLVLIGAVLGGALSYIGFALLINTMQSLTSSGAAYHYAPEMLYIYGGALCVGILAALLPAYRATKIDVAKQLS